MIKNQAILIFIILIIIAVLAWVFITREDDNQTEHQDKIKATMYKSPTCGCCVEYTEYLKKQGFEVEVIKTEDMASIKDEHQIPSNMESCHTLVIDNYFIE